MSKGLPVGSIRIYGGISYQKQSDNKWEPVKEGHPLYKEHDLSDSNIAANQHNINNLDRVKDDTERHLANKLHKYIEKNELQGKTADVEKIANDIGYHPDQVHNMLNKFNFKEYKMDIKDGTASDKTKPSSASTLLAATTFYKLKGILFESKNENK